MTKEQKSVADTSEGNENDTTGADDLAELTASAEDKTQQSTSAIVTKGAANSTGRGGRRRREITMPDAVSFSLIL